MQKVYPIDGTLTGATTLGKSELERNGNEEVLHIPYTSGTGTSLADAV